MRLFLILCLVFPFHLWSQSPEQSPISNIDDGDTASIDQLIIQGSELMDTQPDRAKSLFYRAWSMSQRRPYKRGASRALTNLGYVHARESAYDSARHYYYMAVAYLDTLRDSMALSKLYNRIGISYATQVKIYPAITAYTKAAAFGINSAYDLAAAYGNMGTALFRLNHYDKALQYFNRALLLLQRSENISDWCGMLMNKGNVYQSMGNNDSALYYLDSAWKMAGRHGLIRPFVTTSVNLTDFYLATDRVLQAQSILTQALPFVDSSALQARERNMLLIQFGKVCAGLEQYDSAVYYFNKAMSQVKEDTYHTMVILQSLIDLYETKGDYKQAFYHYKSFYAMQDSLGNKEIVSRVNELEIRYQTAQKDKAIAESQLRISEQEINLNRQRNWIMGTVGSSLLLLVLFSWRYSHIRQKNRRLKSQMEVEQLKAEMEGEQKERARIASELHDGIVSELTAIKMNLEASGNRQGDMPTDYNKNLKELSMVINEVRSTAHNLMPEILLRHGLAEAVGLLCETIEKTGRLKVEYQHYGDFTVVPQPMRQSVYRIIQELLHNIIKHAKADRALLQLSSNDSLLTVELEDNGVGIPAKSVTRMGLSNIEHRVQELKGKVAWSSPENGTGAQAHLEFEL